VRPRQPEIVPQEVHEQTPSRDLQLELLAVDLDRDPER
jgi:hypothetical protein